MSLLLLSATLQILLLLAYSITERKKVKQNAPSQ
jgi:hypothetical protein